MTQKDKYLFITIIAISLIIAFWFYFYFVPYVNKRAEEIIAVPYEEVYPDSQVIPKLYKETPEDFCRANPKKCKGYDK